MKIIILKDMTLNKIYSRVLLMMLVILAASFTACSSDDDDSSGAVTLEAYGPSPALRGSELTFIGKNLDKVTSVILPDKIVITDIEVVSTEQIKVIIPQDAKEGYVKLLALGDTLRAKTLLTYTEPISISSIAPSSVKAKEILTIEGDYLNLIQKVVFADDVEVGYKEFKTWERGKIEVEVPREAQTGIIVLADTATIPVELKSEIELQVVLPSVEKVLDLTNKKPGDIMSVPGKDLDLVESVQLPNEETVEFKVNDNTLSFTLPEGVTDGAIVMVAYSGVKVAIANIGMAVPTELVATPATGIKDGAVITVKGVNMDLVTDVLFAGVEDAVTPTSKSTTEIKVTVPEGTTTGDIILNTASGNTASVAITTLKPEIQSYSPASVAAGSDVTIKGKNLDLVASVTFGGGKIVEVTSTSSIDLKVAVPVDAETGAITLTMKNGETVKGASLTVTKPDFCFIPVLPDPDEVIKSGTILILDVQNADKLTNVQINGNNTQFIIQGSTLNMFIPSNAFGNVDIKLISSNGEVTYTIKVLSSGIVETTIFEGSTLLTWGDGGRVFVSDSAFDNVPAGAILKFYFIQNDNWGQIQINNGQWGELSLSGLGNSAYINTDTLGDKSITEYEVVLTQDDIDTIKDKVRDGYSIILQGSDFTVTKISVITGR